MKIRTQLVDIVKRMTETAQILSDEGHDSDFVKIKQAEHLIAQILANHPESADPVPGADCFEVEHFGAYGCYAKGLAHEDVVRDVTVIGRRVYRIVLDHWLPEEPHYSSLEPCEIAEYLGVSKDITMDILVTLENLELVELEDTTVNGRKAIFVHPVFTEREDESCED